MREIKFRAWHTKESKWVENLALRFSDGICYYLNDCDGWFDVAGFNKDVVLQQYTGLKDKNGFEIYEGDIVAIDMWHGNEHGYVAEDGSIKWHESSAAFKWFSLEEDASDANNYWLTQADFEGREVIGNIYENPELLKAAS